MYYLTVSTDYFLNSTNNETENTELIRVFEKAFYFKVQEGSVLKCLIFRILQSPLGFSLDNNHQIIELVNEWFPTGKFRNIDKTFSK